MSFPLAALVAATLSALAPAGASGQESAADQFFVSDGVRIRYTVQGSGPPVVLIHGLAVSAELNWGRVRPELAREFRVIALDLRGHGKSEKPHDPAAYGLHFVRDVVNLLDHMEIERAHVVGYSMGGGIVLKLLTTHPERVRSAVVGGAGWGPPNAQRQEFRRRLAGVMDAVADTGGSVGHPLLAGLGVPDTTAIGPEEWMALDANDPAALAAVLRGAPGLAVSEEELKASAVPTLVVVGALDRARPAAQALAAVKPQAELRVLPGDGHLTAVLDPALAQVIASFLRANP